MMLAEVRLYFPHLDDEARLTSPVDRSYNCIGWAAKDQRHVWWPKRTRGFYWPRHAPMQETVAAFVSAFATLGYVPDPANSDQLEAGIEKVAIFVDDNGIPTHAARQLPDGAWTSKLGLDVDIRHALRGVEGVRYGRVSTILQRPVADTLTAP